MDAKRTAEADLIAKAHAALGADLRDPWADMAAAQRAYAADFLPYRQLEVGARDSALFTYARRLVRAAIERQKPSSQRLPGYADSQLDLVQKQLLDPRPVQPALEELELEFWLSKRSRELLTADDPDTPAAAGQRQPRDPGPPPGLRLQAGRPGGARGAVAGWPAPRCRRPTTR